MACWVIAAIVLSVGGWLFAHWIHGRKPVWPSERERMRW